MAKKEIKYSEAVDKLNEILVDLEAERIDIDQVSERVKKAVELIKICRERIENTEMEVKRIVKDFENSQAEPLEKNID